MYINREWKACMIIKDNSLGKIKPRLEDLLYSKEI